MGNILTYFEDHAKIESFKQILSKTNFHYEFCTSVNSVPDMIEIQQPDILILDEKAMGINLVLLIKI